jgi:hypothetical protein
MIVKIQRSQPPSPAGKVLVYTKSMKRWWEGKIDPEVDKWMGDDQKIFAHAHIEGTEIVIDREAPWQEW